MLSYDSLASYMTYVSILSVNIYSNFEFLNVILSIY